MGYLINFGKAILAIEVLSLDKDEVPGRLKANDRCGCE
jgi:hypothetical protein